jgi:hypothetical protein
MGLQSKGEQDGLVQSMNCWTKAYFPSSWC